MNQKKELHLFVIWQNARYLADKILKDLQEHFQIIEVFDLSWSNKYFSQNMTRFYGQHLPNGSFKEQHVGKGPFLLIIVEDFNPKYSWRTTSRGQMLVNINTFDTKTKYRSWSGGGHKIHATNDTNEFIHDITLLLGLKAQRYLNNAFKKWDGNIISLNNNIAGAGGWNSFDEFFFVLNNTLDYVILRNFDSLPDQWDSSLHGDIDFLVNDLQEACYILDASKVFPEPYRVHYKVKIANQSIPIDLRYIGDDYYDKKWQIDILKNKIKLKDKFFVPSEKDHFFSLFYHCHVHKIAISRDYPQKLIKLAQQIGINITNESTILEKKEAFDLLKGFLDRHGYYFTKPQDLSVYFDPSFVMLDKTEKYPTKTEVIYSRELCQIENIPYESKLFLIDIEDKNLIRKIATGPLSFREYYFLSKLKHCQSFPKAFGTYVGRNFSVIDLEVIDGVPLDKLDREKISKKFLLKIAQNCLKILSELQEANIQHRDITLDNMIIKKNRLVLIDFQWSVSPDYPAVVLNGLGKDGRPPSGQFDDIYSMGIVLQKLDPKSQLFPLTKAMTHPDPSKRVKNIDKLQNILEQIIKNEDSSAFIEDNKHQYETWLQKRRINPLQFAKEASTWTRLPLFTIFLQYSEHDPEALADTLDSVSAQIYQEFQLVIVSPFKCISPIFHEEKNLQWICTEKSIWEIASSHYQQINGDWLIFLQAGDLLTSHALASLASTINHLKNISCIYFDHDIIIDKRKKPYPVFKPDLNIDLLRSSNYISRAFTISFESFTNLGGVNPKCKFAEDYDLFLRIVDSFPTAKIFHLPDVLISLKEKTLSKEEKSLKHLASKLAIQEHLIRNNLNAKVVDGSLENTFRCVYDYQDEPLVSIIIPTKNQFSLLKRCLDTLFEKTLYKNYEIIVIDNGSDEIDTIKFLKKLSDQKGDVVKVIPYSKPFNYSEANNIAVKHASGDFILLLNNDTEIVQENWLNILVSYCQREDVGAVGARLLFPNGLIQHAGIVIGLEGKAEHVFIGSSIDDPGYMNRLQVDQNYSAVTAACILIKAKAFQKVEGLDDKHYQLNFSDVDFCLKLNSAGYRIIWTPHVTLLHHTSATQQKEAEDPQKAQKANKQFEKDKQAFIDKWFSTLCNDPAYNYNLSLGSRHFEIDIEENPFWSPAIYHLPRIWGLPRAKDGAGKYRVMQPLAALQKEGLALTHTAKLMLLPNILLRHHPNTILFQTPTSDEAITYLKLIRKYHNGLIIFEIDDLLHHIPFKNPAFQNLKGQNLKHRLKTGISYCDRMTVSTEPLAEAYSGFCRDIQIVPNYISRTIWGDLKSKRRDNEKLRVGWAGGAFHYGDLMVIKDVIKDLAKEVDWIFMGMCPDEIRPYVSEYHEGVDIDEYPIKLASLDLDLAIAPLEINAFNRAKSNLRILEYGILGWPVVATDIYPYQGAPVTLVKNRYKAWINAIREKISDRDNLIKEGEKLRKWVIENWILEDHLEEILKAYI